MLHGLIAVLHTIPAIIASIPAMIHAAPARIHTLFTMIHGGVAGAQLQVVLRASYRRASRNILPAA
jgi:hypothetical protein